MIPDKPIPLGYEVGTGQPVEIPLKHLAVTGQTQESGKTTTLEALIARAGVKAIAFVTKRGEKSFTEGRRIPAYFREEADWQFVLAVLEAAMNTKLYRHRSFIIDVCRGKESLAAVQEAVRERLADPKTRGYCEGIYTELDAFLEIVVPQLGRLPETDRVDLRPGLNVMDLTDYSAELQALVIRSTIEWVNEREEDVVTVIPEAWEFVPEGRGSPVKLSAEKLVRKGAGLRNFIWIDSQDLAGVAKVLLRAATVWILGVQREANELKRCLDSIPAGIKKPSKADLARLERGQFFVCWKGHTLKTYVQPAWMDAETAKRIALGKLSVDDVSPPRGRKSQPAERKSSRRKPAPPKPVPVEEEPEMTPKQMDQLADKIAGRLQPFTASPPRTAASDGSPVDEEALYQRFKQRLANDAPELLRVIAERSEIEIEYARPIVTADASTREGKIILLVAEGFFEAGRRCGEIRSEMKRRWADPGVIKAENLAKLRAQEFLQLAPGDRYVETEDARDRIRVKGRSSR